jgi:hypothetical protein
MKFEQGQKVIVVVPASPATCCRAAQPEERIEAVIAHDFGGVSVHVCLGSSNHVEVRRDWVELIK